MAFLNDSDFIDFEDSMLNNTIDDRNSTINIEETNETSNNRLGKDSCKKKNCEFSQLGGGHPKMMKFSQLFIFLCMF